MESISEKERAILKMFRHQISDIELTADESQEKTLIRWLRARDLSVCKAETMFREDREWRRINGIDAIMSWDPPAWMAQNYPYRMCGIDFDNCPVVHVPFGKWDVKKAMDDGFQTEFLQMSFRYFESVFRFMKNESKTRDYICQFVMIWDMEGYSYRQLSSMKTMQSCMTVLKCFDLHYPETLKRAFAVNCPPIFTLFYRILSPMVCEKTAQKLRIHSTNSTKLRPELLEMMHPDQFPAKYGGTGKSSTNILVHTETSSSSVTGTKDENCGGVSTTVTSSDFEVEDFMKATVGAGKKMSVDYDVKEPNSLLSWLFKMDSHDIGFSVFHEDGPMAEYERFEHKDEGHCGSVVCHKSGKYTLTFDNTYSRLRSKTLYYIVNVTVLE